MGKIISLEFEADLTPKITEVWDVPASGNANTYSAKVLITTENFHTFATDLVAISAPRTWPANPDCSRVIRRSVALDNDVVTDDSDVSTYITVAIPPECLKRPGYNLWLGCYGVNGDNELASALVNCGQIREGADPSGAGQSTIASSIVAEFEKRISALEQGGIDDSKIAEIIQKYLEDHPIEANPDVFSYGTIAKDAWVADTSLSSYNYSATLDFAKAQFDSEQMLMQVRPASKSVASEAGLSSYIALSGGGYPILYAKSIPTAGIQVYVTHSQLSTTDAGVTKAFVGDVLICDGGSVELDDTLTEEGLAADEFELINSVTVGTAQNESVIFTADSDGNTFSLKKFTLDFTMDRPAGTGKFAAYPAKFPSFNDSTKADYVTNAASSSQDCYQHAFSNANFDVDNYPHHLEAHYTGEVHDDGSLWLTGITHSYGYDSEGNYLRNSQSAGYFTQGQMNYMISKDLDFSGGVTKVELRSFYGTLNNCTVTLKGVRM